MPHKCVQCGKEYKDSSEDILKGCVSCGGRKFYFIREKPSNREVPPGAKSVAPVPEEKTGPEPKTPDVRDEEDRPSDIREG
ncbi:MAG: Zn-ribbon domain-containing protein, partial [Methanoregulaceae archaeon]|nr:Zn-ribbon domain-containing protein [Methanoregulaceae archaeon]